MGDKYIDGFDNIDDNLMGSSLFLMYSDCDTVNASLSAITAYVNASYPDISITGGTYDQNSGIATFTNNSGGTFTVSGFLTGYTNYYTTGATLVDNVVYFDRTDALSAYTLNLSPLEFTGNTSASCITELWVSNIHGCSPITIHNSIKHNSSTVSNDTSFAFGDSVVATGISSHAEGFKTTASGDFSHAEGRQTTAIGSQSHAEGIDTRAIGNQSHAEGDDTTAIGDSSHAEGYFTTARGGASHAEGNGTTAFGNRSHAEGSSTTAIGFSSHAEGYYAIASGYTSHAEGSFTLARGDYSHAEGYLTTAKGSYSHAGGDTTIATGLGSFIHSSGSTVSGNRSVVLGGKNITGAINDTVYVPNLNINTTPANDNSLTNVLVRASDGAVKYRTISTSTTYGLFAQTGNSIPVINGTEGSIIDGGVGTLSVPANGFSVGDSFSADFGGVMSCRNNETLTIRVKAGSTVLSVSPTLQMPGIINQVWSLTINFTIRAIGPAGTASIVVLANLHVLKQASGTQQGFGWNTINTTTFNTTILNTLNVTAQWGSSHPLDNSIYSDIFILNKIY